MHVGEIVVSGVFSPPPLSLPPLASGEETGSSMLAIAAINSDCGPGSERWPGVASATKEVSNGGGVDSLAPGVAAKREENVMSVLFAKSGDENVSRLK